MNESFDAHFFACVEQKKGAFGVDSVVFGEVR